MAIDTELLAAAAKAFLEHDCDINSAARSLGWTRQTFEYRLAAYRKAMPGHLPEPGTKRTLGPVTVVAPPTPTSPADAAPATSAEVMQAHRAQHEVTRLRAQNASLRDALDLAESQLRAFKSLRSAEPDALNWTMPAPNLVKRNTLMPCLMLSDFQAGEVIKPAELDGMNEYNMDIFHERYRKAIEKTIEFARHHVGASDFPGCMYWQLGDVISGGLHLDLSETDQMASVPQIREVFRAEREGIKQLRAHFGRVHVVRINGNHDRTTLKPRSKAQADTSFGSIISWWLESEFDSDPNVTFHIPSSPDALVRVFGWNVLLSHGDRMGSSGGKGFIGTEAAILRGHHQLFKSWSDGGIVPDLIGTGHFHTETKTVRGLGNGSMAGYSQYARDLRAIPDCARQWLIFMHEVHKVTHNISLRLSDFPRRTMLEAAA